MMHETVLLIPLMPIPWITFHPNHQTYTTTQHTVRNCKSHGEISLKNFLVYTDKKQDEPSIDWLMPLSSETNRFINFSQATYSTAERKNNNRDVQPTQQVINSYFIYTSVCVQLTLNCLSAIRQIVIKELENGNHLSASKFISLQRWTRWA